MTINLETLFVTNRKQTTQAKPVLVLGAGGHARVLIEVLLAQGREIVGLVAPQVSDAPEFDGLPHFKADDDVLNFAPDAIELVNAVGSLPQASALRERLFTRFSGLGYAFTTVIAPSAVVSQFAQLEQGVQILPGAIVNGCAIGANTIINSGAIVEHDVQVGAQCHVAPGAVICGDVTLAERVHVGAGATIIQGLHIGTEAVIGAGSVVTRAVPANAIHYPAKGFIKKDADQA
ncbi:acetyltransferase [Pseudidiomarina donghaiensis]|uniref:Acetyltransferase n=1 Tax=Pseudidiomarina donghaiensis TaxID=519452 RepID=A0A432XLD8_9GAMM|nr:acetyltransferase [Pseudidiomarina donghaiensis]RUO49512.1 acetyltransferase [Pseudidiomarina donghaiensis]SFV21395.1 sugar O-acyltransferase, sialic acid O-acetyltransferase NeuD family [Pseudidiomarina donghaiensis]